MNIDELKAERTKIESKFGDAQVELTRLQGEWRAVTRFLEGLGHTDERTVPTASPEPINVPVEAVPSDPVTEEPASE